MLSDSDALRKINLFDLAAGVRGDYGNLLVARVNDHVVRMSVMERDFHWHAHPDSDEVFIVLQGRLSIDTAAGTEELGPGECCVVPKGLRHRTRAAGRTVNLTIEHASTAPAGEPSEDPAPRS